MHIGARATMTQIIVQVTPKQK